MTYTKEATTTHMLLYKEKIRETEVDAYVCSGLC